ncbi:MAG TPA: hypothetical protein VHE09_13230 [Rhizomicrobium sp.]|nr:hypothetical protein [Rhizomicrobium sp.]
MLQSRIGRNFLIFFFLVNVMLIGGFLYAVLKQPDLLSRALPGQFGPTLSLDLSGNMLFLAILLLVNAAAFLLFGLTGVSHGLFAGLRISPRKLRWLLHERVGLANDISGIVAEAVQEEEKDEIWYLGVTRSLLITGLILFAASLPALCIAYTHAAPDGPTIFENAGKPVSNGAVSQDMVMRFTTDQLAGGLLLDIPEVFHLRATPVETNGANLGLGILVVLYRALIGFGLLLWLVAGRRMASLRDFAMEVAMPAADIVAMEPVLQDGHGHNGHDTQDHGHHDHGHNDPVHHDDHGHGDHAHEDHAAPAHEDHGHSDHGHEDHAHTTHEDHGHQDHGHQEESHAHHAPAEQADSHHNRHAHAEENTADDDADVGDEADNDASDDLPPHHDEKHDRLADGHAHDHATHDSHGHSDHHTDAAATHNRETETVA